MPHTKIINTMMANDFFSQWLGIKILELKPGSCILTIIVRKDMLNGFGIAHGGITYSLADSALAFASNSKGRKSVSIETSISHLVSLKENESPKILVSDVQKISKNPKIYVKIPKDKFDLESHVVSFIDEVSNEYYGTVPVYLFYEGTNKLKLLARNYWLNDSQDVLNVLKSRLGEENIKKN